MQRGCKYHALGGFVRAATAVAAGVLCLGLSSGQSFAGGVTAQPTDSLSVVGSAANLGAVGASTEALAQPASGAAESSWRDRLHVTGYLNQVFGMWLESQRDAVAYPGAEYVVDGADDFSARRKLPAKRE